eukprot:COSAG02_NODE_57867_length_279_cov_0.577778_1_plen_73_part_10
MSPSTHPGHCFTHTLQSANARALFPGIDCAAFAIHGLSVWCRYVAEARAAEESAGDGAVTTFIHNNAYKPDEL